jgi:hypothetical protein
VFPLVPKRLLCETGRRLGVYNAPGKGGGMARIGNDASIRRRARWRSVLTVVGALIVFTTFVVNEWKVDKKKDVLVTVENASTKFDLLEAIKFVQFRVDQLARAAKSGDEDMYALNTDAIRETQEDLDVISGLLAKVPNDGDASSLAELKDQFDAAKNNAEKNEPSDSQNQEQIDAAQKATDALINVNRKVIDLHRQVIADAKSSYSQLESSFNSWKKFSVALYVVGWGVGLAGRLIGGGDTSSSEENEE